MMPHRRGVQNLKPGQHVMIRTGVYNDQVPVERAFTPITELPQVPLTGPRHSLE
jgi:hypothetical protein